VRYAERFVPNDRSFFAYATCEREEDRGILENVAYIGVTQLSVEIHFKDGSDLRITAALGNFAGGLEVTAR